MGFGWIEFVYCGGDFGVDVVDVFDCFVLGFDCGIV